MIKMFNEMSSQPLNDSGIDHGNNKNPKASHLMGIDRDDHSTDTVRYTKWGINKSTVYKTSKSWYPSLTALTAAVLSAQIAAP